MTGLHKTRSHMGGALPTPAHAVMYSAAGDTVANSQVRRHGLLVRARQNKLLDVSQKEKPISASPCDELGFASHSRSTTPLTQARDRETDA